MRKVEISLPVSGRWGQTKTKYPSDSKIIDPDDLTAGSKNFVTDANGTLKKRPGSADYADTAAAVKDQYEAIFADGVRHLLVVDGNGRLTYSPGDQTITEVVTGLTNPGLFEFEMYNDRVYLGNKDVTKVYDRTTSYGGVAYSAPQLKDMGCQAPSSAPTAPASGSGAAGSVPAGAHTYKVTFVYYDTEESNGSAASTVCTVVAPNQTVALTAIPVGGYGVTARKVYRDDNDGVYTLIATIANNTATTYNDTSLAGGALIPLENNTPPDFGLVSQFLDRLFLAGIPGDPFVLYFSEAGFPDIVKPLNFVLCNQTDPITGLVVYRDRLVVFNRNSMGQILGRTKSEFRYTPLQDSIGCIDNRTIRIRTLNGVPTLVWLGDRGLYSYNGNSIEYLSDGIEDLMGVEIQQASAVRGRNTQTSQAEFQAGTASGGIDLDIAPGSITVDATHRTFDDQTDWETGTLENIVTRDGTNTIHAPGAFTATNTLGTLSGLAALSGSGITLTPQTHFDGETIDIWTAGTAMPRAGVLTNFMWFKTFVTTNPLGFTNPRWQCRVKDADVGTVLYTSAEVQNGNLGTFGENFTSLGVAVSSGQRLALEHRIIWDQLTGPWTGDVYSVGTLPSDFGDFDYAVTLDAVSGTGTWTSATHDTGSISTSIMRISVGTLTLPGGTDIDVFVDGSDDGSTWVETEQALNVTSGSTHDFTFGSPRRYYRIRYVMNTADDRIVPSVTLTPSATFHMSIGASTVQWTSPAIDCSTDLTSYSSISFNMTGSSFATFYVDVEAASSADNVTYSSYVSLGGHIGTTITISSFGALPVARYVKVRLRLQRITSNSSQPRISSLTFGWNTSSTLISSAINLGATPAGWDTFQATTAIGGGTVSFHLRTAASSGALSAASWVAVPVGSFPTNAVNQYAQWRVTITASGTGVLPIVDDVTLGWLMSGTGTTIRAASMFFDQTYFLSVAENGETENNLIITLDSEGQIRLWYGLNCNTMSLFFNDLYAGTQDSRIIKLMSGITDSGVAIEMDIRTKAMEFSEEGYDNAEFTKIFREAIITGRNTGTTYSFYFSPDDGETWVSLYTAAGSATYPTTNSGDRFIIRVAPRFAHGNTVSGKTLIFRAVSSDVYEAEIHRVKVKAWIRRGELNA
jgi:hypothetical protein